VPHLCDNGISELIYKTIFFLRKTFVISSFISDNLMCLLSKIYSFFISQISRLTKN
jgi:hypothetical protein